MPKTPPPLVLVVEDDHDQRIVLSATLEKGGYRVLTCASGEEGLKALPGSGASIVLLDLNLPGIDGYEVLRRIRADPEFGRIPVIMLTVQHGVADTVKGLKTGADDYVGKPYHPKEILARIAALLGR